MTPQEAFASYVTNRRGFEMPLHSRSRTTKGHQRTRLPRRPIAEVAVWRADRTHDESLPQAALILVELANKRSVAASARSANELVDVSWLTLRLRIFGTQRTAAEGRHRHGRQLRQMTVIELFGLWKPFPHLDRTTDDGRAIPQRSSLAPAMRLMRTVLRQDTALVALAFVQVRV